MKIYSNKYLKMKHWSQNKFKYPNLFPEIQVSKIDLWYIYTDPFSKKYRSKHD